MSASTPRPSSNDDVPNSTGARFHTDAMRPTPNIINNATNNNGGVATPDVNYNYYDQNPRAPSTTTTTLGSFQTNTTDNTNTNTTASTATTTKGNNNNTAKTPSTDVDAAPGNNDEEDEDEGASPPATFRAYPTAPVPTIDFLHPITSFGGGRGAANDDEDDQTAGTTTPEEKSVSTRVARLLFQWRYPLIVLAAGPLSQTTLHYMKSYTTKCINGNNNKSRGGTGNAKNTVTTTTSAAAATSSSSSTTTTHIVEYYPVTPDWAVEARDSIPTPVASAVSTTLWALGVPTLNALKHRQNVHDEHITTTTTTDVDASSVSVVEGGSATVAKVFAIESEDHGYPTTSTPENAAPFSLIISVASALVLLFVNTVLLVEQSEEEKAAAEAAAAAENDEDDGDDYGGQERSTFLNQYRPIMQQQNNNNTAGNVPRLNLTGGSGSPTGNYNNNNNNARQQQVVVVENSSSSNHHNNTNTTTATTFSSNETSPQLTARHSAEQANVSQAAVVRDLHHHHRNRPAPKIVVAVEGHLSIPEANLLLATIGEHNKYYEENMDGNGNVKNQQYQHLPPNIVEGVVFTSSPTPISFEMEMISEQEYRKHRRLLQRREENPYLPPFLLQSMCSPSGSFSWLNTGSTPTSPTSSAAPSPLYGAAAAAPGITPLTTLLQSDADLFPVAAETPQGYTPTQETYFLVIPDSIDAKFVRHVSSVENFAKILEAGCQEAAETLQHNYNSNEDGSKHKLTTVFVSIPSPAAPTMAAPLSPTQKHASAANKLRDLLHHMPGSKHHHDSPTITPLTLPASATTNSSRLASLLSGGGGATSSSSTKGPIEKKETNSSRLGQLLSKTAASNDNDTYNRNKGELEGFVHPYDVMYVFSSSELRNAAMMGTCSSTTTSPLLMHTTTSSSSSASWCQQTVTLPLPPSAFPYNTTSPPTTSSSDVVVQPSSTARLFALLGGPNRRDSDTTSSNEWSSSGPLDPVYPAAPIFASVATLLNHRHEHVDIQ